MKKSCMTCDYCEKHPTMYHTSMCLNKESEHYGSLIDEDYIFDKNEVEDEICWVRPCRRQESKEKIS